MTRKRNRFTKEFKIEALRLMKGSGRAVRQIARELGVKPDLLYRWRREEENAAQTQDAFPGNGVLVGEAAENQRLRRELERVTQERDFLKNWSRANRAIC